MEEGGCADSPPTLPLEGTFRLYGQKGGHYSVHLDARELTVSRRDADGRERRWQTVRTKDIVGCLCMKAGEKEARKDVAFFTVYSYPLTGSSRKKLRRTRLTLTFEVEEDEARGFEDNLRVADRWRSSLLKVAGGARGQSGTGHVDRTKKLLVLINPNSGPGKALQMYKKQVSALFGEAEIQHEVVVTQKANHALDLVRGLDLNLYAGCVIISGDGLLYEFYNGMLERPDWQQAIQFPVGIIPGGSGNGLARSIAHWKDEPYLANPVLVSALNQVYGRMSPMDLVLVQTPEGKRTLSFLSIGFGLISDIDIESERLRSLGESRFTIWAIARVANLRKYKAEISFRRIKGGSTKFHKKRPVLERSQTVEEEQGEEVLGQREKLSRSSSVLPEVLSRLSRSSFDLSSSSSSNLVKVETNPIGHAQEVEVAEEVRGSPISSQSVTNGDSESSTEENELLIPEFSEALPPDWETVEDNFTMVYACYQSHISSDAVLAPDATPDDGIIWLLMVRGNATKASVARFLLALDGSYLNIPGIELIPVDALRIIPKTSKGFLTVDGEVIPWGPVQATMLPSKGRIITR